MAGASPADPGAHMGPGARRPDGSRPARLVGREWLKANGYVYKSNGARGWYKVMPRWHLPSSCTWMEADADLPCRIYPHATLWMSSSRLSIFSPRCPHESGSPARSMFGSLKLRMRRMPAVTILSRPSQPCPSSQVLVRSVGELSHPMSSCWNEALVFGRRCHLIGRPN